LIAELEVGAAIRLENALDDAKVRRLKKASRGPR
jgi:hypothetical protein